MRRFFGFVVAVVAVPVALFACANDDYTAPGPKARVANEAEAPRGDATAEAAADASTVVPVRCTAAEFNATASDAGGDQTGGSGGAVVSFPRSEGPVQYTNNCVKVKVGTVVTFTGSFMFHPLQPNGGDTPTPIPALTANDPDGGALAVTMSNAGTFGYQCQVHPGIMYGAIQVVP